MFECLPVRQEILYARFQVERKAELMVVQHQPAVSFGGEWTGTVHATVGPFKT